MFADAIADGPRTFQALCCSPEGDLVWQSCFCFGPYGREVGTQREPVCERWKLWEAERMTILRWCFATFDTKDICDAAVV